MKTIFFSALAILGLVASSSAQMALRPGDVKINKVAPSVVKTPEINFSGGSMKRFTSGQWLEVEVEFETAAEMIDELTFNYKILVNGKMLVGEVTHVDIPKGREHFSVAYVAPRSLEGAMGGKPLSPQAIQGIWVDASRQGLKISEMSSTKGPVPNAQQIPGKVLNKSQTPFAPLYWDRYEALKAMPRM